MVRGYHITCIKQCGHIDNIESVLSIWQEVIWWTKSIPQGSIYIQSIRKSHCKERSGVQDYVKVTWMKYSHTQGSLETTYSNLEQVKDILHLVLFAYLLFS